MPLNATYDYSASCGSLNCPGTPLSESTSKPTLSSIYALFGTLAGATILSIIIVLLFVDNVKYNETNEKISRAKVSIELISNFIKFFSLKDWFFFNTYLIKIEKQFKFECVSLYELAKSVNIWLLVSLS